MIKIFRKLRRKLFAENQLRRYSFYAIGEIALVVIGILIALQINNRNEMQKSIAAERDLLTAVLENIRTDSISLDSMLSRTNDIIELQRELIEYSKGHLAAEEIGNLDAVRRSEPNQLITKKNNPNLSNQVRDLDVKKVILEYYLEIDWLNFTILNNNQVIEHRVRPYLGEHHLLNYGNQFDYNTTSKKLVNRERFLEEFEGEDLKQLLFESGVKLSIMERRIELTRVKNEEIRKTITSYLNDD